MIPVDQRFFGRIHGDCYRAALASIFEVPLETLPPDLGWMRELRPLDLQGFLAQRGFRLLTLEWKTSDDKPDPWPTSFWHLLGGMSPRGNLHATVGRGGVLVHDPHPSRAGLLPGLGDADLLIPLTTYAEEVLRRPLRGRIAGR